MNGHMKPADIEKRSFAIITEELGGRTFPESVAEVVKRVIHTSADFDYADNLVFSDNVVERALRSIQNGASIVTDTQMAKAGINKKRLAQYGGDQKSTRLNSSHVVESRMPSSA